MLGGCAPDWRFCAAWYCPVNYCAYTVRWRTLAAAGGFPFPALEDSDNRGGLSLLCAGGHWQPLGASVRWETLTAIAGLPFRAHEDCTRTDAPHAREQRCCCARSAKPGGPAQVAGSREASCQSTCLLYRLCALRHGVEKSLAVGRAIRFRAHVLLGCLPLGSVRM